MSEVNDSSASDAGESVDSSQEQPEQNDGSEQVEGQEPPKPRNIKRLKYKVDGEEIEEDIDLDDEENLKRHLQMSKAANKRMKEAHTTKKQAEDFIKMLQDDPIKVLSHEKFGGSKKFREIAEQFLAREIEEQMLSPEEKNLRDREAKLKFYEEQERTTKEKQQSEQMQKLEQSAMQDIEKTIGEAFASQNLPKTVATMKKMAYYMSMNIERGLELSPAQLAKQVREDYVKDIKDLFGSTEGDALLALMGDDVTNKIRKSDLARLRGPAQQGFQQAKPGVKTSQQEAPPANMSKDEWKAWIDRRAGK